MAWAASTAQHLPPNQLWSLALANVFHQPLHSRLHALPCFSRDRLQVVDGVREGAWLRGGSAATKMQVQHRFRPVPNRPTGGRNFKLTCTETARPASGRRPRPKASATSAGVAAPSQSCLLASTSSGAPYRSRSPVLGLEGKEERLSEPGRHRHCCQAELIHSAQLRLRRPAAQHQHASAQHQHQQHRRTKWSAGQPSRFVALPKQAAHRNTAQRTQRAV